MHRAITGLDVCVRKPLLLTCGADRTLRLWNYATKMCEQVKHCADEPLSVSLHPSGNHALVGFSDKLRLFNVLMEDIRQVRASPLISPHLPTSPCTCQICQSLVPRISHVSPHASLLAVISPFHLVPSRAICAVRLPTSRSRAAASAPSLTVGSTLPPSPARTSTSSTRTRRSSVAPSKATLASCAPSRGGRATSASLRRGRTARSTSGYGATRAPMRQRPSWIVWAHPTTSSNRLSTRRSSPGHVGGAARPCSRRGVMGRSASSRMAT